MRLTSLQNTGIVPPHVLSRLGFVPANGNTAVVPPHLQPGASEQKQQTQGDVGGCFPNVPPQKDGSDIDVVFTDVKLPKKQLNLTGYSCFPHLPPKNSADATGVEIFMVGVKLPN